MFSLYYNNSNHFPICNTYHASMRYPTRIKMFHNNLLSAPRTLGVDGVMSYGGGTGKGLDLARKSFGEYYERNHFFTSVPVTGQKSLQQMSSPLGQRLEKCIDQVKFTDQSIGDHAFYLTCVHHLLNDTKSEYLFNAISLNGKKHDGPFYNFNDSCSCAVHTSKEKVMASALKEFIERQALVGSWVTKQYRYAIDPIVLLESTIYRPLAEKMLKHGELYIFENNVNLPGYSTIIFYFSNTEDDLVKYSVGSSAGFTLEESLNGSFEELWQCYLFQYNAENSKGLEDRSGAGYHLSFQACNHSGIRDIIPFLNEGSIHYEIVTPKDLNNQPMTDLQQSKEGLAQITSELYYYHHFDPYLGLHYAKIVSPDYFVHMALEQPLNIDNAYSASIGLTPKDAYLEKIPFP